MTEEQIHLVRLAYVEGVVGDQIIDRVGGDPIGVTRETWPTHDGTPLVHVLTLSQELIVPRLPGSAAAVAVFSSDARLPSGGECRVVFLSPADIARGTARSESVWGHPVRAAGEGLLVGERSSHPLAAEADEYGGLSGFFDRQRNSTIAGASVIGFSGSHVYFGDSDDTPEGQTVLFWLHCPYDIGPFAFGDANVYVSAGDSGTKLWERF